MSHTGAVLQGGKQTSGRQDPGQEVSSFGEDCQISRLSWKQRSATVAWINEDVSASGNWLLGVLPLLSRHHRNLLDCGESPREGEGSKMPAFIFPIHFGTDLMLGFN